MLLEWAGNPSGGARRPHRLNYDTDVLTVDGIYVIPYTFLSPTPHGRHSERSRHILDIR